MWNIGFPLCPSSISFIFLGHLLFIYFSWFKCCSSWWISSQLSCLQRFSLTESQRLFPPVLCQLESLCHLRWMWVFYSKRQFISKILQLSFVICIYYMIDPCIMLETGWYRVINLFCNWYQSYEECDLYYMAFKGRKIGCIGIMA